MDNGTILTAIVGACAATIGVVVAKDSKISEFRQQWIDALREDIAKLCSTSVALYHGNVRYFLRDRLPELSQPDTSPLVEEANNLGYRIRLRLDKRKRHSQELIDALDSLVHLATHARESFEVTNRGVELVMEKADIVLENAWTSVKRGEPRFRWTFRAALASLLMALGIACIYWLLPHLPQLHK
jgi:hypothetical protein